MYGFTGPDKFTAVVSPSTLLPTVQEWISNRKSTPKYEFSLADYTDLCIQYVEVYFLEKKFVFWSSGVIIYFSF